MLELCQKLGIKHELIETRGEFRKSFGPKPKQKIRSFQIDPKRLEEAADRMRAQMLEYIKGSTP